jgi:hypothetical protein
MLVPHAKSGTTIICHGVLRDVSREMWTKIGGMRSLKTSVLTKTPRDCTAPSARKMYSPDCHRIPYHTYLVQALFATSMNSISQTNSQNNRRKDRQDALQRLVDSKVISEDGKQWLTAALDPFHDFNHQLAGYPDADVSQTVVSCYTYEHELSAPPGTVGTWSAHIVSLPMLSAHQDGKIYNQTADWTFCIEPNPSVSTSLAPIVIYAGADLASCAPQVPAIPASTQAMLPATNVKDLSSGCTRIIGAGFEVHNTTADIYKQGSVTTYRMPQSQSTNQSLLSNTAETNFTVATGTRFRAPPTTLAQANLLKGTRTWEARDGVYATLLQSSVSNPLKNLANEHIMFDQYPEPGTASNILSSPIVTTLPRAGPHAGVPKPTQTSPFDTTGAMFTGLSKETTLVIKARFYVERAPTWNEPALAVLASPSAGYDVAALELYAQCVNMLPAAVHVGENAKGDWWRAVLSVIKHVAAPLGMALSPFVPGAGIIGGAVSTVAGQIDPKKPVSSQSVAQAKESRPRKPLPPRSKTRVNSIKQQRK